MRSNSIHSLGCLPIFILKHKIRVQCHHSKGAVYVVQHMKRIVHIISQIG